MRKTQNDVDKLTVDFIIEIDQRLRAGSRDAWEQSDKYGYVDKGIPGNKNNKNNSNTNKPAPRVAKATESAPKQKKDPPKKKRFDPPCNYCITNNIPEPKRSSHQEQNCHFKSGKYTWRDRQPAQTQATPQAQAPPQAAGRVDQGTDPATNQGEDDPQPMEEQRENAVRDHFEGYLNDTLPEEISAGNSNATRESRVSVFAIRHSTRKRREEQIEN